MKSCVFDVMSRRRGIIAALALIVLHLSVLSLFASSPGDTDEVKKLIKQAEKLTREGSFTESEALLRRAVEIGKGRSDARLELAFVLTKQRSLEEAYEISYDVARMEPKNSHAFAVLGMTLLTGGRFTDARPMLINALRLNRREHLAREAFGLLEFYENRIEYSLENLREAVFYEPLEPDYLFALAQVAARAERYKEAADNYEKFLSLSNIKDEDRRSRIKGLIDFLRQLGFTTRIYRIGGKDETKVPFELVGNRPVIDLTLNDKPFRFVLDTGSGISVISEETAKKLKIKPVARGGWAKGIGGDGKFEIVYGFVREIGVGDVTVRDVPVYIRKFHKEGRTFDGYIGLSLISKFLTTIDYGKQTFSLTKRSDGPSASVEKSDLSLPLRLTSSGFLSGEVLLEGVESPLNFIVDTGASVSVISSDMAKIKAISSFVNDEKLRVVGSAGVTDEVPTFMLPRVTFGKNSSRDIMAVALNLDIINEASGFEQSGILGGNFLKNYRLTFDFKNSIVTFVSVKPEKE